MTLCYYHPIGKHASITPSASTSVTNERESGVGGVASDEGRTRGKNQSNDSSKTMTGSDRGRGVSPISSSDPQQNKGPATNSSRGGGRKWGTTKSSKDSSVASTMRGSSSTSTSSNAPHHQGGLANAPHLHTRGKVSRPRLITTTLPHPLRLHNQIRLNHRSNLLLPLHLGREMITCQRSSLHLEEQHNSRPQLLQGVKETNPGQYTSNLLAIRTVASYIVLYTMHVAMSFMSLKFYINFVGFWAKHCFVLVGGKMTKELLTE